jgi:hypothetical protein
MLQYVNYLKIFNYLARSSGVAMWVIERQPLLSFKGVGWLSIKYTYLFSSPRYWPEGIRHENILLLLSDPVPYVVKAGKNIKILNPKMEHITCVAHVLHRLCKEIRLQFPKVNKLISSMIKMFLKAPSQYKFVKILHQIFLYLQGPYLPGGVHGLTLQFITMNIFF